MSASRAPASAAPAWWWDQRCPVAAELEATAPSAALAARLEGLDPRSLGEEDLVEAIAACDRVTSWLAVRQARFVAALSERSRSSHAREHVPDLVAARLGISPRAGQATVALADGLERFPSLAEAMADGRLSPRKAQALLADVDHLPGTSAGQVLDEVLPEADRRTVPQLRRDVRRVELTLEPDAAARRHRAARADRSVWLTPAPDAMAWVRAFLPAPDAAAVMTALDCVAARRSDGDERTADQRRADALTALARRVLDTGLDPEGRPVVERRHRRAHLHVTVDEATLRAAGWTAGGRAPRAVRLERAPGHGAASDPTGVAHLAGYGLVPLAAVEHLVADARISPAPVDRRGLPVTDAGPTDAYRPSAELARQVVDRDRTCRFPGCGVPADRCDIDHVVPFDPDRPARWQTVEHNLQALCRHHHRLKTHGAWSVARDPDGGTTTWRSPTGRTYTVAPEPVLPPAGVRTGAGGPGPAPPPGRAGPGRAGPVR